MAAPVVPRIPSHPLDLIGPEYFRRLIHLVADGWQEAILLSRAVRSDQVLATPAGGFPVPARDRPTSMLIDVKQDNTVDDRVVFGDKDLLLPNNGANTTLESFTDRLKNVGLDVHTRILVFTSHASSLDAQDALRRLFIAYILGEELQVRPGLVHRLVFGSSEADMAGAGVTRFDDKMVAVEVGGSTPWKVLWQGKPKMGGKSYFQVVILLDDTWCDLCEQASSHLWYSLVPTPSTQPAGHAAPTTDLRTMPKDALKIFYRMLCLSAAPAVVTSSTDTLRLHWLCVLLRLAGSVYRQKTREIIQATSRSEMPSSDLIGLYHRIANLSFSMHNLTMSFQQLLNDLDKQQTRGTEADWDLAQLGVQTGQLRLASERVDAIRSTESVKLSAKESRTMMLLTLLAFIFVPISLAASVFGMNVQEINSSGHRIWTFVVTAIVMLVLAAMSLLLAKRIGGQKAKANAHANANANANTSAFSWIASPISMMPSLMMASVMGIASVLGRR